MYFEWPWFISRLIYVSHYMFVNWRRRKNWVIFCRPITLNLSPTIHYIKSKSPKITGSCRYYTDQWRSRIVPKHFHMLQQNNFFYRLSAVSINTKHVWATITCRRFFRSLLHSPCWRNYVSSQPVFNLCLCIDDNIQRTFQSFLFNWYL